MYTRIIPSIILTGTALVLLIDYFLATDVLHSTAITFTQWAVLVGGFAAALASVVTVLFNVREIQKREENWYYAIVSIGTFVLTCGIAWTLGTSDASYNFLINTYLAAIAVSVNAAGGLKFASGIYRSARARTWEAGVLLAVLCLMLLKKAPIGEAVFPPIGPLGDWVDKFVSRAGSTGLVVGAAIGAVILGARMMIGQQPAAMGGRRREVK
jgi:hypothetical protein